MNDSIYFRLRDILDSLPNGFPTTDDGLEIKILKKVYTEEEAEITTKLKLKWETPDQIAERTGMDAEHLKVKLKEMHENGQIGGAQIGEVRIYRLIPYIIGIYEYQLNRIDEEFAMMNEKYFEHIFKHKMANTKPGIMRVIPVEKELDNSSVIEPYESVTQYIDNAKSWAVGECICKKEKRILGKGCDHTLETCVSIAPIENFYDDYFWGRPITKEEAHAIIKRSEEEGLVHMTNNTQKGPFVICNCCECSCGVMRGLNEFGLNNVIAKSNYIAVVDEDICTACGYCKERCHVHAIDIEDVAKINERCLGCGLCKSTCPVDALTMKRLDDADILEVPHNEKDWWDKKEIAREGSGDYKKLLD